MSWQDRQGCGDSEPGYGGGGGGLRSWFGGLPPPTKAVKWIAIANVVMLVLCLVTGGARSFLYTTLAMRSDLVAHGQIWRLFTFTYLHDQQSLWHILFNMAGLYFFGGPLEQQWGTRRFFVFYTLAGFVGVLVYFLITMIGWLDPSALLVGASGGVLGVLGACAVLFPAMNVLFIVFCMPIRLVALICVAVYAFNLWNRGFNAGGDACHLAGLVFGIAYGYRGDFWAQRWSVWRANAEAGRWEARQRQRAVEMEEVDRILEKVHREGINRLSRREKQILAEATRKQQEADRRQGL